MTIFEERISPDGLDLKEKVVHISRVSKVVKGGRRFSFSAVVAAGDGNGHVGYGLGKAHQKPEAICKGIEPAKKALIRVPLVQGTLPYAMLGKHGAGKVLLKPASPGTGLIAGGGGRAVMELAGVHAALTKCLGSTDPHNLVPTTLAALRRLVPAMVKPRVKDTRDAAPVPVGTLRRDMKVGRCPWRGAYPSAVSATPFVKNTRSLTSTAWSVLPLAQWSTWQSCVRQASYVANEKSRSWQTGN